MPLSPGFRATLAMDSDDQRLGNSPGDDGRGRLHTFIANTASEPVYVSGTIVIPPGLATASNQTDGSQKTQLVNGAGVVATFTGTALNVNIAGGVALTVELDHTNDSVSIWGTDGVDPQEILTDSSGQILIGNFPSSFNVTQGTSPWVTSVSNFPATVAVTQSTSPWVVSGSVSATQSGAWSTGRTWTLASGTDSVAVSGTVAVTQSTSPWVVSGTVSTTTPANGTTSGTITTSGTVTLNVEGFSSAIVKLTGTWSGDIKFEASLNGIDFYPIAASDLIALDGQVFFSTGIAGSYGFPVGSVKQLKVSDVSGIAGSVGVVITGSQAPNVLTTIQGIVFVDQIGGHTFAVTGPLTDTELRAAPVIVSVSNFPAIQPVSQSGSWTTGRTWTLSSGTDSVAVSGTVAISGTVAVTQSTSPWVVSGAVTANQGGTWNITNISGTISLPTGAATETTLAALNAKFSALGQNTMAASVPVVIASNQSAISVAQSGAWSVSVSNFPATVAVTQSTSPWVVSGTVAISGTVAVTQSTSPWVVSGTVASTQSGTWTTGRTWTLASGTDSVAAVQSGTWNITNISGTISLPTGAATSALQTSANASLSSIDTKLTSPLSVAQSGTWNITNISGTISLPTGAATSALQTTGNTSLGNIDTKLPATLGQKAMAASLAVVIASDQTAIPISKTPLTASAPTASSVGVASASVLAANANRKGAVFVNTSINIVSLGINQTAVLNSGITLYPGGTFQMDEYSFSTAVINAIASAAASNLAIQELT